jgi:hypothetical protein
MMESGKTDVRKLQKISVLFFRLAWIGGIVGFCLLLAIPIIVGVVGAFRPEMQEMNFLIPCFALLGIYFMINMSIKSAIDCVIEVIGVKRKELTRRNGLEQAFVYFVFTLSFLLGVYWIVRELVKYVETG